MQQSKIQSLLLLIFIIIYQPVFSQYIPYCQKDKWGFASIDGKIVVPCVYDAVDFYSDDLARVKKMGKVGYINNEGAAVVPFQYDECFRIYEVHHGEHSIGINYNPEIHLNNDFDFQDRLNNRFIVAKNKKYGVMRLIDGKSKIVIPLIYSNIQFDPSTKTFHCLNKQSKVYFSANGKKLTEEEVNNIEKIQYEGVMMGKMESPQVVKSKGKTGVILKNTSRMETVYDTLVPAIYDDIITKKYDNDYVSDSDVFGVKIGKKWGIVGSKNNVLLPVDFDEINFDLSKDSRHWAVYQRTFVVKKNDRWGILGKKDESSQELKVFLPFEFNKISKTYYSYLMVEKDNRFQIFNMETYNLISEKSYSSIKPYEYESVNDFHIFEVKNKLGQTVYLGKNGVEFFVD
ncbi:WG repeat-containing protein [Flavobacterium panacagri]|uniref:WG repeat-containing protein n=1 Tax=Flavobacterium panacagri TaxID=3034146 RepID=UPI0025A66129|nr:WG repeat-containing protein [Flavobacterium panacagri]